MTDHLEVIKAWLANQYEKINLYLENGTGSIAWTKLEKDRAELADSNVGILSRFVVLLDEHHVAEQFNSEIKLALEAVSGLDYRSGVARDLVDSMGAWQVQIVWVVTAGTKEQWLGRMRELRARSAHAEEIGLELIDASCKPIQEALDSEGMPSLMFETRAILLRNEANMPAWRSPDTELRRRLEESLLLITDKEQRQFSTEILESALQGNHKQGEPSLVRPRVGTVRIRNVRNIADAEMVIGTDDFAAIVHGPNGTGKSSLFEAVCIALIGTSKRHCEFLEDKDVIPTVRSNYAGQVLKRFGSLPQDNASVSLEGEELLSILDTDVERIKGRLVAGRGTVLAQESAREFLAMTSAELASYILGDYSELARKVQAHVDEGAQYAKNDWQEWLRSYGLNASISKSGTILRRLVAKVVHDECPPESHGPLLWVKNLGETLPEYSDIAVRLRAKWEDLDSLASRDAVIEQAASAVERSGVGERPISNWLTERASVSRDIVELISTANHHVSIIRDEWISIKDDITRWSSWLLATSTDQAAGDTVEVDSSLVRQEQIRARLEVLAPIGQKLRLRKDHLAGISERFLLLWSIDEPHICPTCDVRHEREISAVVKTVLSETSSQYDDVRSEYARLQQEEKEIRSSVSVPGAPCPISPERKQQLADYLRLPVSGPESIESLANFADLRQETFSRFERLFAIPAWKEPASSETIGVTSTDMAAKILQLRAEGADKQEMPTRWDHLKKNVDSISLEVVSSHLPRTIGALWRELSLILAPAYWIQACKPQMTMELKRGAERLGVTVGRTSEKSDLPARYILNQAEQHVLGLAWFFTRFLTHGRFLIPFIALDDPAQEMDQVTFRKFVRFVQAFQRIHRVQSIAFGVLVLLHQEERGIDFARAIARDGALTVLEWSETVRGSGPNATVRKLQLRNPEQFARAYSFKAGGVEQMA